MILITNRNKTNFNVRKPVVVKDDLNIAIDFVKNNKIIAFDFETTGLNIHYLTPLLLGISDGKQAIIIDCYGYRNDPIFLDFMANGFSNKILLGHNLKFDFSILLYHYNCDYTKISLFDSLIIAQRLWQGYDMSNDQINGIKFSLDSILKLYEINDGKNTETTHEFVGIDPDTFVFSNRHILYTGRDVLPLFMLKDKLLYAIKKARMEFLIFNIELPLIKVLAKAELTPLYIDEEGWINLHKKNLKDLYETDVKLDNLVNTLKDDTNKHMLSSGKFDRKRVLHDIVPSINLFGEVTYNTKKPKTSAFIDWNSDKSVIEIIAKLGLPCPHKIEDNVLGEIEFIVPTLNDKGKVVELGFSVSATNINLMLTNFTMDDDIREFYTLLKHRNSLSTLLSSFGIPFLDKKNRVTEGYHTTFRQCRATNGRLQSGGGKREPDKYNCQNIPANNEYRNLFSPNKKEEDEYHLVGADLVGAEAVIMADKAKDKTFLDNVEDLHSYMGTKCWKAILLKRASIRKSADLLQEAQTFYISKNHNKEYRNPFKRVTFGIPYGASAFTVAKALKISEEEGKLVLDTYNKTVPNVMHLMQTTYNLALQTGKVVLNYRTNSVVHFPAIKKSISNAIKANKEYNVYRDLVKSDKLQAAGARNYIISGTQADALKETMVVLDKFITEHKLDATIVLQVHDELQVKFHNKYLEKIIEYGGKLINSSELVTNIMLTTCNQYLTNTKFGVETEISKVWKK